MKKQKNLIDEMNWDILIILDAMRYDIFKDVNTIRGSLSSVESEGTWTMQWFIKTFTDEKYDIWLISANPMLWRIIKRSNKMNLDKVQCPEPELGAVPAHFISQQALRYIDKRMIIHYMQPHFPAIGETKMETPNAGPPILRKANQAIGPILREIVPDKADEIIARLERCPLDASKVELINKAYRDNAIYVIDEVKNLLPLLKDKKVIITADHGTYLGEEGRIGHGNRHFGRPEILTTVPWLKVKN